MKMMWAMKAMALAAILVLGLAAGCSNGEDASGTAQTREGAGESGPVPLLERQWADIEARARGSRVRFYMYGGWAHVNAWVDGYVARRLAELHDITLVRVPMDAAVFVNKLVTEKAAGKESGSIDLVWINGENFRNAREADLLLGPFAGRLPNFRNYVDPVTVIHDFGFPVDGYEAPWGRAQFVFEYDSARTPDPPRSFAELAAFARANPGRVTYPQPPDFTGSAFVRQAFYAVTGGHEQYMGGFEAGLYARKAPLVWDYLNDIKPWLWQKGRTYPRDSATLDTLFGRGEVDLNMSYHPSHAASKIKDGTYPDTVRTFVMEEGTLFNTHFTAIPANSPNKAAALVTANFLLSPEAQLSKYDPENWGDFPAVDLARLPDEWRARFADIDLGRATLDPGRLAAAGVPEIPSRYLERLEEDWDRFVLRR
jgi:putative spermidine/putrescine transport system substrate-binding protein